MMIVRSNCKQYLDELAVSARMILDSQQQQQKYRNEDANGSVSNLRDFAELVVGDVREMTNFELKYWTVGEPTFESIATKTQMARHQICATSLN